MSAAIQNRWQPDDLGWAGYQLALDRNVNHPEDLAVSGAGINWLAEAYSFKRVPIGVVATPYSRLCFLQAPSTEAPASNPALLTLNAVFNLS